MHPVGAVWVIFVWWLELGRGGVGGLVSEIRLLALGSTVDRSITIIAECVHKLTSRDAPSTPLSILLLDDQTLVYCLCD